MYDLVTWLLPDGMRFSKWRVALLRWCGAEIGEGVLVHRKARIEGWGRLILEDGVQVGQYSYLCAGGWPNGTGNKTSTLRIGHHTMIAHNVSIKTSTHEFDVNGPCIGGEPTFYDITIGPGCWICAGAIIIPKVSVGEKCVIAAGAVVTRDAPPYSLLAGVPAKVVKTYDVRGDMR